MYGAGANDRYQLGLGEPGKVPFPSLIEFEDPVFDILMISSSGSHTVSMNELICTSFPTASPTEMPTDFPTVMPTSMPTNSPTILESESVYITPIQGVIVALCLNIIL